MKNFNRYTVLPIFMGLIYVIGCGNATTTAPKGWLPSLSTAQHESYGGWVSVRYQTGVSESEVHGELIAIHLSQVFILNAHELTSISSDSISRVTLTITQLSGDSEVDLHQQMIYPAKPLDEFRAHARFPQGLSKTIDMQFLKPKGTEMKILVPAEVLESLQKDQSKSLSSLTQQNSVQAVDAAAQDANTYVDKNLWFLVGFLGPYLGPDYGGIRPSRFQVSFSACCGGSGVAAAERHIPSLPAGQLLGKPPKYVATYASAYYAKAKSLQVKNAWAGSAACCSSYLLGMLMLIAASD
ncbi:MAG: hypothetical protein OXL96_21280 [Candidatus Poribacteria bacterium]|nr:hypothetical protein [Candidatus Poribacteria bacterium]